MTKKLPTLTTAGWVSDVASTAIAMMDYFIVAEHSQTQFYPGSVSSLTYLVQQHGENPLHLADAIESTLRQYFNKHFDNVAVRVTYIEQGATNPRYNLDLDITFNRNGEEYQYGRLLGIVDSRVISIENKG